MSDPLYPLTYGYIPKVQYVTYYEGTPYASELWVVECPDCGYVDETGDCFDNLSDAYNCAENLRLWHYCPYDREVI